MIKLKHLSVRAVANANVFRTVTSYDELNEAIINYGGSCEDDPVGYKDRTGEAEEVLAEFFYARFGGPNNARLGVVKCKHTSMNKYHVGYDFDYTNLDGLDGQIQVKFRSSPVHKFGWGDLGTFVSRADLDDIPKNRRILFTNQDHKPSKENPNGLFKPDYPGYKQMIIHDRSYQEEYIIRDPLFWSDLASSVEYSAQAPSNFDELPTPWEHQDRMFGGCVNAIGGGGGRSTATQGSGKTLVELLLAREILLNRGGSLVVVIAPTIDLLTQHHKYFEQYGLFHVDNVSVIHFRTGDEARTDAYIEYAQTTGGENGEEFGQIMARNSDTKTVIFVTYASEEKLFNLMERFGITANAAIWDEYQFCIRQNVAYRDHLLSLPVDDNFYFSASLKLGRIISSIDQEIFGPELHPQVTYAELRAKGILVPKIIVKPIQISSRRAPLERAFRRAAERDNFDLRVAATEAAASIIARDDLLKTVGVSNLITFSQAVPICKAIVNSHAYKNLIPECLIQTVHADVPSRRRSVRYERVKGNIKKNILPSSDSILHQHSCCGVGMDVTSFNGSIISRNMNMTVTHQGPFGRIVRAHPDDTKALKEGKITVDSPEGWKKYSATVYVIIFDEEMEEYKEWVREIRDKLLGAGLTLDDWEIGVIGDSRHGTGEPNDGDVPIDSPEDYFDLDTLNAYLETLRIEDERAAPLSNKGLEQFIAKFDFE